MSGAAAAADVLALSEANQPHVPFRHVVAEGDAGSRPLEDPFRAAGWTVDKELVMALTEGPDREVDTRAVIDLSEEQMLALMRRWLIEERPGTSADRLDQVEEYNRREGRLWRERRLGLLDSGGAPAAVTKLRSDGTTAWVEDVYTVPEARGRGYARVLVGHAAELARSSGHELTFIIADDNDWPKHLYARIGFRPIGLIRTFHRDGEVTS
jgi:GNAT superfamily N-acetyltransferase